MANHGTGREPHEAVASGGLGGAGREISGTFAGGTWQALLDPERPRILVQGREIHVKPDGFGGFVTHDMFGRWFDLGELAKAILQFHPDYSPLARRTGGPVA